MRYTLEELLQDKELRKQLLETAFTFSDDEGDFFALDFQNESMRQNHITAFEVLFSLGGNELFEKILKEGNTCLANSPDAAKIGVKEISGAQGWYLKTNASAFNAFTSILFGLSSLDNTERFTFTTEIESSLCNVVSKASDNYTTGLAVGYEEIYTLKKNEDESFSVVTIEDNKPVTFHVVGISYQSEIEKIEVCESILKQTEEYNDDTENIELCYSTIGYKFKTSADGKWGFFNKTFSQFIPPMFSDIILTENNKLIAYDAVNEWSFFDGSFNDLAEKLYHMYFGNVGYFGDDSSEINMSYACCVKDEYKPSEKATVDKLKMYKDDKEYVFYSTSEDEDSGLVFIIANASSYSYGRPSLYGNAVKLENYVLKGEKTKKALALSKNSDLTVEECIKLYSEEASDCRVVKKLYNNYFVVEKEGYLGIAKMIEPARSDYGKTSSVLEFDEMVTPYAFTDIQLTLSSDIIVDRFGKKGLFRIGGKKYIIPCDYDELIHTGFGKYKVSKADFTGVIEVGNEMKWIEKLHREG